MEYTAIIRVPEHDAGDLSELTGVSAGDEGVEVLHPFDGEAVAQIFVVISAGTLPYFQSWVNQRIQARKGFVLIHKGIELRGYTADEAERLVRVLTDAVSPASAHEH